ncbi:MAG: PQQ-dependent sugar dehydrogenase [Actinomycetota bacterium]|nr:PQQ-dependent sugar dehydrogenase [Actinomycetota bacterium]
MNRPKSWALGAVVVLLASACAAEPDASPAPSSPSSVEKPSPPPPVPEPEPGPTSEPPEEPEASPTIEEVPEVEIADVTDVVTGLDAPWGLAFLPDGAALVTERDTARVYRVDAGELSRLGGPGAEQIERAVVAQSEGGLLGIAVSPEFAVDSAVFVYLTASEDNQILRLELDGDELGEGEVILDGIPKGPNHNGGRLAFGPDGYLFATTGDTYDLERSQDRDSLGGKILRMTPDGEPAPGNPFDSLVWTWGHRNVQGIGWAVDGRMFASEFGQDTWDELNLIEAGGNYGWPEVEGQGDGGGDFESPLHVWPTRDASPSGIAVTREGVYLAGLRGNTLWRVPLTADGTGEPQALLRDHGRLRAVVEAPDGSLWVLTNNTDGRGDPRAGDDRILRLEIAPA